MIASEMLTRQGARMGHGREKRDGDLTWLKLDVDSARWLDLGSSSFRQTPGAITNNLHDLSPNSVQHKCIGLRVSGNIV